MRRNVSYLIFWVCAVVLFAMATSAYAQRPYIGYVYPAGAQQGTTLQVRLGGQELNNIQKVLVSGRDVTARLVKYQKHLNNQEIRLLNEQLKILKATANTSGSAKSGDKASLFGQAPSSGELAPRIEQRVRSRVHQPACAAIANLAFVEVSVASDAEPGDREIRLVTSHGISNPLVFNVGQVKEVSRKPMDTSGRPTLGKEAASLRKRPEGEAEVRISLPCTVNGQIAPGEVNRYRFEARKGQRLVFSVQARQLIPYIADAVPGWFQPVIAIRNRQGSELAFSDRYNYNPDPLIIFTVPENGEYVCIIRDSIYRGREDFVYRMTIGELPFITHLFPLGGKSGSSFFMNTEGVNLGTQQKVTDGGKGKTAGLYSFKLSSHGLKSNEKSFAIDDLPDIFEHEQNDAIGTAQEIDLPCIINGRIDSSGDLDVFKFRGKTNQVIVVDVMARRLGSPLDSFVKVTDARGRVLAVNDDFEDLSAGSITHHSDSNLAVKLPAEGIYYIHLSDTARKGGAEYGYRLRVSEPRPDFQLRVVPSGLSVRPNGTGAVTVYVARRDGFVGPVRLVLKNPPAGFSAQPVTVPANKTLARFMIKAPKTSSEDPVNLIIRGTAKSGQVEVARDAVAAEDRMQAFLWRHLLPAGDLKVQVTDPAKQMVKRPAPVPDKAKAPAVPVVPAAAATVAGGTVPPKPGFTRQQCAGRLRQLEELYREGLLTGEFYDAKAAECDNGSR